MASKKPPSNKNDPGQTRSETTSAAQTIFNLPKQPQSPVTTENIASTINKAVQDAFAQKEKMDMAGLKKVQAGQKHTVKTPAIAVAAAKAEQPKPGTKKVSDDELMSALLKEKSIRAALRAVGLNETSMGSRNRAKKMLYNYSKKTMEEAPEKTPEQPKKKLKIPAAVDMPAQGRQKFKVRMKPTKVPEQKPEPATPTGAAINEIATKLPSSEPQQVPTKPKVKFKGTVPTNVIEPAKETPVSGSAIQVLNEKAKLEKINTFNEDSDGSRLKALEQELATQKAEKAAPVKTETPKISKDQARSEAADALKSLGFDRSEIKKLLAQLDHIVKTEDKILYALKLKGNPAAKIPRAEVPAAVEEAKAESSEQIVEPKKEPELRPSDSDIENAAAATDAAFKAAKNAVRTKTNSSKKQEKPTVTPMEPVDPNAPEQLTLFKNPPTQQTTTPVTPTPVAPKVTPKSAEDDEDQKRIEEEKRKREEQKAQEIRQKRLEKKLDDIAKSIGKKGIFDLISQGISNLLKGLIPKLLGPLLSNLPSLLGALGKASLVIGTGILAYEGATYLLKKMGYTGEGLGKLFSDQDAQAQKQNDVYNKYNTNAQVLARTNDQLKGTGYTSLGMGNFKDANGNTVKADDLPLAIKQKIKLAPTTVSDVKDAINKLDATAPPARSMEASNALNNVPPEDNTPAPAPIIVQQGNQTPIRVPVPVRNDGGAIVKVRNDEPSAGGLLASIFEHPRTYGGVYRM